MPNTVLLSTIYTMTLLQTLNDFNLGNKSERQILIVP